MSDVRRVFVLRHGETAHNAGGVWQGHQDTELSAVGVAQARVAAADLAERGGVTRIVSSDLTRALTTAYVVGEALGLPVRADARLREINVGSWQGLTQADVVARDPSLLEMMSRGEDFRRGGDGESVADVVARASQCVEEELAAVEPGGGLLVVTHGVSGRSLAAWLVGLGQQDAWLRLGGLGNCHWAEVAERRGAWRIEGWNLGTAESGLSLADR